jgi:uncharacterized membrane protein YoaK (UPF0700 family)
MPYASNGSGPTPEDRPLVFAGAICLAAIAGYINVVVLGVFHVPVSHMTGAVSRLSIDVASGDRSDLRLVSSIVAAFFMGAVFSGAIIGGRKFLPGRRYGVALVAEGAALAIASVLLTRGIGAGIAVAAFACGIQNAMASSYYGLVLRTTHVTGIVTDLGVMAGHWIRHRDIDPWKPALLASILLFFFGGGAVGHYLFELWGIGTLMIAAGGCVTAGTMYYAWQHYR